jgi:hypothetical protein
MRSGSRPPATPNISARTRRREGVRSRARLSQGRGIASPEQGDACVAPTKGWAIRIWTQ